MSSFDISADTARDGSGRAFTMEVDGQTETVAPVSAQSEFVARIEVEREGTFRIEVKSELRLIGWVLH
ncbi:MAG: hypothetical protein M1117_05820, partial [Candidatus Thermoplasmatota archaeon]|nr:hypothetical protein [Candidatus Thermoplasmatota archaeon]